MHGKLEQIGNGHITLIDSLGTRSFGDPAAELRATVRVTNPRFYRSISLGGSIGAGESFCDGHWQCDDLVALIRIFARNMQTSNDLGRIGNAVVNLGRRVSHCMNRNTPDGSRRNIAAHYDLSNDFYSLFLDETMTYSSGIFNSPDCSMLEASREKYDRLCRMLQLTSSDRVLEIGTGWGGFAIHAAKNYGCHVTTTTISKQQHDYAAKAISDAGLSDRIDLKLSDYRDLGGQYDKIVSIEMIEAVGHEFFDTYFAKCSGMLKPCGLFALQAITIPDQRYDAYRKSVDFIQRYIFPGGFLPSLGAMANSVGRVTDLQMVQFDDFAMDYARTLECWRRQVHANLDSITRLGMSDTFLRMWHYYLCYCEGAFREKQIGVAQLLLQKQGMIGK
ncbi:MAG: cyclopropane-fatty-acyl-phospholipid synthase family protein [Pirellulaceae bacterium]